MTSEGWQSKPTLYLLLSDVVLKQGSKYITLYYQALQSIHACALVQWHAAGGVVGRGAVDRCNVVLSSCGAK